MGDSAGQGLRVALLDDYQGAAADLADWSTLGDDVEVVAFRDHLEPGPDLIARATPARREWASMSCSSAVTS